MASSSLASVVFRTADRLPSGSMSPEASLETWRCRFVGASITGDITANGGIELRGGAVLDSDLRFTHPSGASTLGIENNTLVRLASGSVLSGAGYRVQATSSSLLESVLLNEGTIVVEAGRQVISVGGSVRIVNEGAIVIEADGSLWINQSHLVNEGTIVIEPGGVLAWGSNLNALDVDPQELRQIDNRGLVELINPLLDLREELLLPRGIWSFSRVGGGGEMVVGDNATVRLGSAGSLEMSVRVSGELAVFDRDVTELDGDAVLTDSARLRIQVSDAGATPRAGRLSVTGALHLAGELVVDLERVLRSHDSFGEVAVLAADGPVTGAFDAVSFRRRPGVAAAFDPDARTVTVYEGCSLADIELPVGTLDLADITAFVEGFVAGERVADLDGDGVFDLADIVEYVSAFNGGCL